jgi:hypothetical protein
MRAYRRLLAHAAWGSLVVFLSGLPVSAQEVPARLGNAPGSSSSAATLASGVPAVQTDAKLEAFPDSPGATWTQSQSQIPATDPQPAAQQQPAAPQAAPTSAPNTQAQDPQQAAPPPQRPVGTAAAESPNVSGVAASQPSGVAIAPAKQHRARTIMIRVGALMGAGVAVGTVVALTAATPSKPPGAH